MYGYTKLRSLPPITPSLLDFGDTRRPIQAGEEVLLAEHILIWGVKSYKQNYVEIVSACRQSSHWNNYHETTIKILFEENKRKIISKCTCPAGLGEKWFELIDWRC
ncbi:uncharacterized protein LOC107039785 [Diachasma alloeum]|uniref:uncharacterized protein LOC107039785 n=1 Tax=Diachasma alloeum TaxID=454923 RepID=UPI0007383CB2|nr:uncharacterized protein LOC107039785 [Diachasma alloeum]